MALPTPQVGDLLEFKLVGFLDQQTCMNIFHYTVGSRSPGASGPDIVDCTQKVMDDLWDDNVHGLSQAVTTDFKNVSYTGQIIHPVRTIMTTEDPTTHPAGQLNPPTMPTGVSAVVRRKGIIANRHNQGRLYVAGIAQEDVAGSELIDPSATLTALSTFSNRLGLAVDVVKAGVTVHLVPVLVPLPAGTPIVPVDQTSVDKVIRYQRRREVRVGI